MEEWLRACTLGELRVYEFLAFNQSPGVGRVKNGYAQLASLPPAVSDAAAVRAEIVPATQGMRFWAFFSITDNETQHVTLITPQ